MKSYLLHSTLEETGLIEQVKVAIDENVSSEDLAALGDTDTLALEDIILSKVPDGARLTVLDAPHWMLGTGVDFSGEPITWHGTAGHVTLPSDYLRLVMYKMSDWSYGVTNAIGEDSADYLLQSSRWLGIRGNAERPVVAIVHHRGLKVLEFYSCLDATAVIARAEYIPVPEVTGDGTIALCPLLLRPTVYRIAELTALAVGAADTAVALLRCFNDLLTITNDNNG